MNIEHRGLDSEQAEAELERHASEEIWELLREVWDHDLDLLLGPHFNDSRFDEARHFAEHRRKLILSGKFGELRPGRIIALPL